MDPPTISCHNSECPARGQIGNGNIGVHSGKERRYTCHTCGTTFNQRRGTAFDRLRTDKGVFVLVVTLLAHGCPIQAIVMASGLDERTVIN
jgi:transposase-like protein